MENTLISDLVAFNIKHAENNIINLDNWDEESDLSIDLDIEPEINPNKGKLIFRGLISILEYYAHYFNSPRVSSGIYSNCLTE